MESEMKANSAYGISGFKILSELYRSTSCTVFRAERESDGKKVVLKILNPDAAGDISRARYWEEYAIARREDLSTVVRAIDCISFRGTVGIVFEDVDGVSLAELMKETSFSLSECLEIGISISTALKEIHERGIVHKDLNPFNIIIERGSQELRLTDFGSASVLTKDHPHITDVNSMKGSSLSYMSPEQTGRMNRSVDYRADFYALGIVLYELCTESLPFASTDPIELVHYHIAKKQTPPVDVNSSIPKVVSAIIEKLLSKNAEDRYQSAFGIQADLKRCLDGLNADGAIPEFPLALDDVPNRFQIAQKLYGRQEEIDTLMGAFDRVCDGACELVLVTGYSGIGKSSLVQEIYKTITQRRGYYIEGKYDQLDRSIPYSAIVDAFRDMLRQLLTCPEAELDAWRRQIVAALGPNGQIIASVIPEIEMVIGPQEAPPKLGPEETRNRFNIVFQNFIGSLSSKEHPLVIFLDDLQWIDAASLSLLQIAMTDLMAEHLLVIGAFRDNEVDTSHPLTTVLDSFIDKGLKTTRVSLGPLEAVHIGELLADSLGDSADHLSTLTQLVLQKTRGNPFFIDTLLGSLYEDGFLEYSTQKRQWTWNASRIEERQMDDDVAELIANQMRRLAKATRLALRSAACLGNKFELATLSEILGSTSIETAHAIRPAVNDGLIVTIGDAYKAAEFQIDDLPARQAVKYKFSHDKIQQAALSLIPLNERPQFRLGIGRLLLSKTREEEREKKIFDIVGHLNAGSSFIDNREEKVALAKLNLEAGEKALVSSAFETAAMYFDSGLEILGTNGWQESRALAFELHISAAEAACQNAKWSNMTDYLATIFKEASEILDLARAYEIQIRGHMAQFKIVEAVDSARTILGKLGISLPSKASQQDLMNAMERVKAVLPKEGLGSFDSFEEMTDPAKLAAVRILTQAFAPAYLGAPDVFPLLVLEFVHISASYGFAPNSCFAYATYGLIVSGPIGDAETGHDLGRFALQLMEKFDAREFGAKTLCIYNVFIGHWKEHLRDSIEPLSRGHLLGLETGDFEYGAINAVMRTSHQLHAGLNLAFVERETETATSAVERLGQSRHWTSGCLIRQVVLNLTGSGGNTVKLTGEAYDEEEMLPVLMDANDLGGVASLHVYKSMLSVMFGDFKGALEASQSAKANIGALVGQIYVPLYNFCTSLACLQLYAEATEKERHELLEKVDTLQAEQKKWAEHAPMNYRHRYLLVEAERAVVNGNEEQAATFFGEAIEAARENKYVNDEALANEFFARFLLSSGKTDQARAHVKAAMECYKQWGAGAVASHLETTYQELLPRVVSEKNLMKKQSDSLSDVPFEEWSVDLDLSSVMKASQAISGEIVLERLLARMIHAAVENAGAEQGALILKRGPELLAEVRVSSGEEPRSILQGISVENCTDLSAAIVRYVARTKETVVLGDASNEGAFIHDEYIRERRPLSILCLPILHHGELSGIFYLENNLATHAFTSDRLDVLKLLASQAAISIENAKLYEDLKQSAKKHQALMEAMPDGVLVHSEGTIRFVNQKCVEILGAESPEDLVGRKAISFLHPDYRETGMKRMQKAYDRAEVMRPIEYKLVRSDDKIVEVEMSAAGVEFQGAPASQVVIRDITDRKLAERQMFRAEKMASLGQIIAGVAHEINNPNNFIYFNLPILQKYIDSIKPILDERAEQDGNIRFLNMPYDTFIADIYKLLENMKHGSKRITDIVSDLKNYVRSGDEDENKKPEAVDAVVKQVMTLVGKQVQKSVKQFDVELADSLPRVRMNAGKIEQVLINLVINAGQAADKDQSWVKLTAFSADSDWIEIHVEDNGSGISEENLDTIFEPFFTTKADESGTGLGLAISYQIIEDHGGTIDVTSHVGKGTKFTVRLPAYEGDKRSA